MASPVKEAASGGGHTTVPMPAPAEAHEEGEKKSKEEVTPEMKELIAQTNLETGLTSAQYAERLAQYGENVLEDKKRNKVLLFLSFLWGPMPIMIWIAIIIELIQASISASQGRSAAWEDFGVLLALQFANAIVGFVEENNAGDAIDALKKKLAPKTHVFRNGAWAEAEARVLVPGDLIELKLGDIIPADAVLLEGSPLLVDQAALTGESLPTNKAVGSHVKMGSVVKQGHTRAIVVGTAANTFFGKAAKMIASVQHQGRLQAILLQITFILSIICVVLCAAIFAKLMAGESPEEGLYDGAGSSHGMRSLSVVVVILVASIPVAIEVVVTSTMAVGSHKMASHNVIVARLSAIEELAGMSILCSDKTGTLTLNKLTLRDPYVIAGKDAAEVIKIAALASKREGNMDAIDSVITHALAPAAAEELKAYVEESSIPFDPVSKIAQAVVRAPDGRRFRVAKGAPQKILELIADKEAVRARVNQSVADLAKSGYRALGVAVSNAQPESTPHWEYLGILSIYDPPRPESKATIQAAKENGVAVKMITGDQTAIARQTCADLGMGTNVLYAELLDSEDPAVRATLPATIMNADGFGEVMPEHKFRIVEELQKLGHVTGMTGDGVNDAPALKKADIGIAVPGATDAAKAAAAIVIAEPDPSKPVKAGMENSEGLQIIIHAIFWSRQIFQRMRNYLIYRIACTLQLLLFFFFGIMCINADTSHFYNNVYPPVGTEADNPIMHAPSFTLPVLSLVIITILNDGCMITISSDNVKPENRPQKWDMLVIWIVATVLGLVACLSSLILLAEGMHANVYHQGTVLWGSSGRTYLTWIELKTILYLKISISDFLTLFSARSRGWFWERCVSWPLGIAFVIATGISTLLALFWYDIVHLHDARMASLRFSPGAVVATWIYCILWFFVQDIFKRLTYYIMDRYFKPEEIKMAEEFAEATSVENRPRPDMGGKSAVEYSAQLVAQHIRETAAAAGAAPSAAPAMTAAEAAAAEAAAQGTLSGAAKTLGRSLSMRTTASLGERGTAGRVSRPPILPNDVDLEQVVQRAAELTRGHADQNPDTRRALADIFGQMAATHAAHAGDVGPTAAQIAAMPVVHANASAHASAAGTGAGAAAAAAEAVVVEVSDTVLTPPASLPTAGEE